ncbi:hypothetical protein EJB05_09932 [Eragrostis curvula]|uniref:Uncharacterized protein n=1 Tax=Eragrostis curvula TaxID=38414 RepID=A0A5J9W688_9POAL|nr:hypothetical protein EJB05_09932 [Eragrostis curvula]
MGKEMLPVTNEQGRLCLKPSSQPVSLPPLLSAFSCPRFIYTSSRLSLLRLRPRRRRGAQSSPPT